MTTVGKKVLIDIPNDERSISPLPLARFVIPKLINKTNDTT